MTLLKKSIAYIKKHDYLIPESSFTTPKKSIFIFQDKNKNDTIFCLIIENSSISFSIIGQEQSWTPIYETPLWFREVYFRIHLERFEQDRLRYLYQPRKQLADLFYIVSSLFPCYTHYFLKKDTLAMIECENESNELLSQLLQRYYRLYNININIETLDNVRFFEEKIKYMPNIDY